MTFFQKSLFKIIDLYNNKKNKNKNKNDTKKKKKKKKNM